jgi:hypothetical protein
VPDYVGQNLSLSSKLRRKTMGFAKTVGRGLMISTLALLLCVSLAFTQADVVVDESSSEQTNSRVQTRQLSVDAQSDAVFNERIEQIREEARIQVADIEAAMQASRGEDNITYLRAIEEINRNAEIDILEVRRQQEMARGNVEMAEKFRRAAQMLANPPQRQAPDPELDQQRFETHRNAQESPTR